MKGDKMTRVSFGDLLRKARMANDLSQRELAEKSGVSFPQIGKFELGSRSPSKADVGKLIAALNVPRDYFFAKRSKAEMETKYEEFLNDYDELKKFKLDEEQLLALHWVIKRILIEVRMDNVRKVPQ